MITKENPLQNFKTLYATGAVRVNDATNKPERVGGIDFVVKDGIVYDAKKLLADVAAKVEKAKQARRSTTTRSNRGRYGRSGRYGGQVEADASAV